SNIPFLDAKPGAFPYVRGTRCDNYWQVRQTITVNDPKEANTLALEVLMKGVDSLGFCIQTEQFTAQDLDTLLNGIEIKYITLAFSGKHHAKLAQLFTEKVKKEGLPVEEVKASFDIDPIVKKLTLKGLELSCNEKGGGCIGRIKSLIENADPYKRMRLVTVNGQAFGNSGATIVQELAFALAVGHEYVVKLMEEGLSVDQVAPSLTFNLSVSANYFMEIAKFRAARLLWANIMQPYHPQRGCSSKMRIHAVTSEFNMTVYDPYVNMLRGTTEAMSATLGGVDSLEVLPFDYAFESPTDFSSRIARNVQLLLKEESHFDQVVDPAGGSYYIENLTVSIAEQAWKLFREVEDKGGYVASFKAGFVQEQINRSAESKRKNLATRREILLGTNQYPNFLEKADAAITPATVGVNEGCSCGCRESHPLALKPFRGGMDFEQLRLAVDRSGKNPKAFMLTVGNLGMARARAQFSGNFFGCAGIEPIDNIRFDSVRQGVEAALAAQAEIVVLCSSDDEYAELAPEAFRLLDGKAIFVVAGAPACQAELEAAGIKNFINVRSNVLETLKGYVQELGINLYQ
ncbi:MAG: acyl-CoA mutase large subunit family protein, partial [Rikenellaceae bacterium]|nr:acyl-CoA mutase large subunit family protein [Rikenellaceae bacterium]